MLRKAHAEVDNGVWFPRHRVLYPRSDHSSNPQLEPRSKKSGRGQYAILPGQNGIPQVSFHFLPDVLPTGVSRESVTEEYKTMLRAVEAALKKFPAITHDIGQAKIDPSFLIAKIRKVRGLICTRSSATYGICARMSVMYEYLRVITKHLYIADYEGRTCSTFR